MASDGGDPVPIWLPGPRVSELAGECNVDPGLVMRRLSELGIRPRTTSDAVDARDAQRVRETLSDPGWTAGPRVRDLADVFGLDPLTVLTILRDEVGTTLRSVNAPVEPTDVERLRRLINAPEQGQELRPSSAELGEPIRAIAPPAT